TITGTGNNDTFDLYQGGEDTVQGGGGDDVFRLGATFDAGDRLDGGTGTDKLVLKGDYSAGVVFNDLTIQNIETILLKQGSYNLTVADGNVAAGQRLTINGAHLGAGNSLVLDGSAETDGFLAVHGGAGNDTITAGQKADVIDISTGGIDTVHGEGGH